MINLRIKKLGYSVVPFDFIYLSIHLFKIDLFSSYLFRILVRAFHVPITPHVKRALVTMDTAVFVLLDIGEFSVKQVRRKTSKMMSSDSSKVKQL